MYFSISPQSVALPGGPTLDFRVNPDDTSKVEIHVAGEDARGNQGTHVLTFNRNGGSTIDQFVPSNPKPVNEFRDTDISQFKSVNDDAVRFNPKDPDGYEPPSAAGDAPKAAAKLAAEPTIPPKPAPPAPKSPANDNPVPPKTVTSTSLDGPAAA